MGYIRQIKLSYLCPIKLYFGLFTKIYDDLPLGVLPQMYANSYKNYIADSGFSEPNVSIIRPSFFNGKQYNDLFNSVEKQIENGYPVPLFIEYIENVDFYNMDMTLSSERDVNYHWVTIIGTQWNDMIEAKQFIIVSWGNKYIINYDDIYGSGILNNSMLILEEQGGK